MQEQCQRKDGTTKTKGEISLALVTGTHFYQIANELLLINWKAGKVQMHGNSIFRDEALEYQDLININQKRRARVR